MPSGGAARQNIEHPHTLAILTFFFFFFLHQMHFSFIGEVQVRRATANPRIHAMGWGCTSKYRTSSYSSDFDFFFFFFFFCFKCILVLLARCKSGELLRQPLLDMFLEIFLPTSKTGRVGR